MNDDHFLLQDLNPEQREAVTHFEGPLLVLSGAGSGKTRVITRRIAYLVEEFDVEPGRILGLTFTNKAAAEMEERVGRLLVSRPDNSPWLGTFHSLGARFLREFAPLLDGDYDRYFTIFDAADQRTTLKEALEDLDLARENFPLGMVASYINGAKNDLIGPDSFRGERVGSMDDFLLRTISRIYRRYQDLLENYNALDFGDLIRLTVGLLRGEGEGVERWRRGFKFILVDEYQDTNHGQYVLARLLAAGEENICVVGDDDQAIFGWRGADVGNILDFEEDYPQAEIVHLSKNYRSTRPILRAASSVITNNDYRKEKPLEPQRGEGERVAIYEAADESDEADFVARRIEELRSRGVSPADVAILYRVNTLSRELEEALVRLDLPYEIIKGTKFYERKEVKDILAYLRLLVNREDEVSLWRGINVPRRGIGKKTEEAIRDYSAGESLSSWQAMVALKEGKGDLSRRAEKRIGKFVGLIEDLKEKGQGLTPSQLVGEVVDRTDYFAHLKKKFDPESAAERKDNVKELVGQLEAVEEEESLEEFLEKVALESNIGRFDDQEDGVSLMTLHSAKGLEFRHVFIVGLEEGLLPHNRSIDEGRLEEERRLCYVGITRAQDRLYLTRARKRFLYGQVFHNSPSRFLEEMEDEELHFVSSVAETGFGGSSKGSGRGNGRREAEGERGLSWRDFLAD